MTMTMDTEEGLDRYDRPGSWAMRRRFLFSVTAFCALVIGYVLVTGKEGEVAEAAVTAAFLLIAGVTGSYVFGATWSDRVVLSERRRGGTDAGGTRTY